jgi:YjbE family integral membrane protein
MIWGCGMAIAMRIALTLVVAHLLLFPGLRTLGAVLLAWIACKLIQEGAEPIDHTKPAPNNLMKAIFRIAMADFIMSLDNVVAIAGASQSDPVRIILGLFLSISMLLLLSAIIMEIMSRHRWIAYVGTAVLAVTAADMMIHDIDEIRGAYWGVEGQGTLPSWAAWSLRLGVTVLCLTTNYWWPRSKQRQVPEQVKQTARSYEGVLD